MFNDFYVALIFGWLILLFFWSIIILFIYFRKPPNSKLSRKIITRSYLSFFLFFGLIFIFKNIDSFL
jgi:hypothetical protein